MPYVFNTPEDQRAMLDAIGAASIDDLFASIPKSLRFQGELNIPRGLSELELSQHIGELASHNSHTSDKVCFLGGGSYDHFIPAVVDALSSRGEFYTSYTPYQAEVSQGNLQATFEYQTLICQLTGMDVSNASLYDGGSAAVEAVLMSMNITRRPGKVVTAASVHPEYRQILETYLTHLEVELVTVGTPEGQIPLDDLARVVDDRTACVLVQHPNFFGCLEQVEEIANIAHQSGAMLVQSFDPISLGLLKRPGDLGADIAVAEGQSLGNPMAFGGPYLGVMACREDFVRRMPGRIAGETTASGNRRCWVLTLQTREQHIRREKATSNICTNQGLYALRASIYLALMGPQGMREVAELCVRKSNYAAQTLTSGNRYSLAFDTPFFKEFVVRDSNGQIAQMLHDASQSGYFAGISLGQWYPELDDCFLMCVTEQRTKREIDSLARCLVEAGSAKTIHA